MKVDIWRVYACRYDRRYIVVDFLDEEDAIGYCQEHDWQLTNRAGERFDLTFECIKAKRSKNIPAAICFILGFFLLILAGGSESISTIFEFGVAGIISLVVGLLLEVV